jgi:hypothetical protein
MIRPSLIFAILFMFSLVFSGYMHEVVHREIFTSFGVESEIQMWQQFPNFATVGRFKKSDLTEQEFREMENLHLQNEIMKYNIMGIELLFGFGFFFIILLLEKREND